MSMKAFEGLEPASVWKYFGEICRIPRGSKNETAVAAWVEDTAKKLGCTVKRDDLGNVVVRKPATKGCEKKPTVVIQGHLDMVCEKNKSKQHDFTKDPIVPIRDGEWIKADGTTLGADNGIAVAAALALMEDTAVVHGPLEFFLTVDEETGMSGVKLMDPKLLEGRILLNLDSEEEGILYIGCAGGVDTKHTLGAAMEAAPAGFEAWTLAVTGCKGGHSGCDIHEGRANAIKVLTRVLWRLNALGDVRLAHVEGGNKRNALAREAEAVVYMPAGRVEAAKKLVATMDGELKIEFKIQDSGVALKFEQGGAKASGKVMTAVDGTRVLRLLYGIPHGALQFSAAIKGLVETSTNLGVVTCENGQVVCTSLTRSSLESAKADVAAMMTAVGQAVGAEVEQNGGYPGWNPDLDSKALIVCKDVYRQMHGREPEVKAIHAGLECAIIGGKIPDMDMISFGPTITGPHSPDERLNAPSVPKFYAYTKAVLAALAK